MEHLYSIFKKYPVICTDTRKIVKNSIFFALKGDSFDGNQFAEKALKQGSVYAVIDNISYKKNDNYIYVPDSLKTLQNLAKYHRAKLKIPIIGITGTNGKTTTKELISILLSSNYSTVFTQGNLNNHIGVPLTLLTITDKTEIAIVEMGANHIGEIADLCQIAQPTHGIITNIGKAHLEGFGSEEGVIKAKNELYKYIKKHNGTLFVNHDDTLLMDLSKHSNKVTYGSFGENIAGQLVPSNTMYIHFQWKEQKQNHYSDTIQTHFIGSYNFNNILAAISIGNYFNVDASLMNATLETYSPKNNRSEIIEKNGFTILLDAYNANPSSMELVLKDIIQLKKENKILILGDMLELGKYAIEEHQKIANIVQQHTWEKVILIGKHFKQTTVPSNYIKFETTEEAKTYLSLNKPYNPSFILLKGSRGIGLEKLVKYYSDFNLLTENGK